jgi:hypothetical protein
MGYSSALGQQNMGGGGMGGAGTGPGATPIYDSSYVSRVSNPNTQYLGGQSRINTMTDTYSGPRLQSSASASRALTGAYG